MRRRRRRLGEMKMVGWMVGGKGVGSGGGEERPEVSGFFKEG